MFHYAKDNDNRPPTLAEYAMAKKELEGVGMNMQELKNKIWQACKVLESADFDLCELEVEFDIDIRQIDSHGLSNNITNISYNLLEEQGKVKITIE